MKNVSAKKMMSSIRLLTAGLLLVFGNACSRPMGGPMGGLVDGTSPATTAPVQEPATTVDTAPAPSVTTDAATADTTTEQETAEDTPREDDGLFFLVPSEAAPLPSALKNLKVSFHIGVYTGTQRVADETLLDRTVEFAKSDFRYKTTEKSLLTTEKNEYGVFYSAYDVYENEDGDDLKFLSGTDLVTYYYDGHRDFEKPNSAELTAEEATAIANEFLGSILPQEVLDDIPWVTTSALDFDSSTHTVIYIRTIHGYYTDEDIMVMVDANTRSAFAYNGECVGKYADLESVLTKDVLDQAYDALKNKVDSLGLNDVEIVSACLVTDTAGGVYMEMSFEYSPDDEECARHMQSILTKVEIPAS